MNIYVATVLTLAIGIALGVIIKTHVTCIPFFQTCVIH